MCIRDSLGADGDTFFDDVRPDVDDDGLGGGKRGRETAGSAPQKTETVRRAIMKTLADIGARERSRMALRDVAAAAVSVVAPFAVTSGSDGKSSPATAAPSPELISLARDAVKSLATVAPDAVWTALAVNATGHSGARPRRRRGGRGVSGRGCRRFQASGISCRCIVREVRSRGRRPKRVWTCWWSVGWLSGLGSGAYRKISLEKIGLS